MAGKSTLTSFIVNPETPGQLEAAFHFDHIFGDGQSSPEETINQDALGFQPLANLASNGTVKLNQTDLEQKLSSTDYQQLAKAIAGLGHMGEGHCVVNQILE